MRAPVLKVILSLLLIINNINANEVDIFNILLPTAYHPTAGHAKQLITTSGGCYTWESTYDKIVSVSGITNAGDRCQSDGVVSLLHQGAYLSSVYITATEQESGSLTTIPVRIRDLNKISVFTKSRVMNIKQMQNLQVYGFDVENNTFTSLEGLAFKWTIREYDGKLDKIPLRQSSLYTPLDTRKKLQANGMESDLLIVKALKVGTIQVTVRCLQQKYSLIQDTITLVIQQKFQISPAMDLNLLAGSSYQFHLLTPIGTNISLPAQQYTAYLNNGFTVTDTLQVTAPTIDTQTKMNVSDIRTTPAYWSNVTINSYEPDRIEIVCPQQILIGKKAKYKIEFYRNNKLLMGTPNKLVVTPPPGFQINEKEGTISTSSKGSGKIRIDYQGLSAQKQISSVTPVSVILPTPRLVVLPVGQSYQLRTLGGSGLHKYEIHNRDLARVSITGLVTTRTQGQTKITVLDQRNNANFIQIKVLIVGAAKINNFQKQKQSNVNQHANIYVSVIPNTDLQSYFTQCNDAFKRIQVKTSGATGVLQIISIYGSSSETLTELNSLQNKFIEQILGASTTIPQGKQELKREYELYVKEGDISRSQLNRIVDDMQHYGICSKVIYKGLTQYDGTAYISTPQTESTNLQLRIYRELETMKSRDQKDQLEWISPDGVSQPITQIYMTPLSSFKWVVNGGSYSWDKPTEVYLNGIKLNQDGKQRNPVISCPARGEASVNKYILQLKNPVSKDLLRPTMQDQELIIHCQLPSKLKATPLIKLPTPMDSQRNSLAYKMRQSTIFLYPKQSFYILIEPLTSNNQVFYNSSNIDYLASALPQLGKVVQVHQGKNYVIVQYNNEQRHFNDIMKRDEINMKILGAETTIRYSQAQKDQTELSERIYIMILQPIQILTGSQSIKELMIPSSPTNVQQINVNAPIESGTTRTYSFKCLDDSLVVCSKQGQNIKLQPRGSSGRTRIEIVDDLVVGAPKVSMPIRVLQPSGVDLKIVGGQRASGLNSWAIQSEEIEVAVQVYSSDKTSGTNENIRGIQRLPIKSINPDDITISFESSRFGQLELQQIQRHYNPATNQIIIRYITPTVTKKNDYSSISKEKQKQMQYTVKAKMNKYPLSSNEATLRIFSPISTKGGQPLVSKNSIDSLITVMNSCKKFISITGGPTDLETQVFINVGQGYTHKLTKLTQRKYQIEAIRKVGTDKKVHEINGQQDNLIAIKVRYDGNELATVRYLVVVEEIGDFGITGISQLIPGRQARLLAEADNIGLINTLSCDFKFTWRNLGQKVVITSDANRIGINVTAKIPGRTTIELKVTSQNDKLLGKAVKQINVVSKYKNNELPLNQLIILPPNSGMVFPSDTEVEQVSPCDQQNQDVSIIGTNQVRTGGRVSDQAQIVKISAAGHNHLPGYANILVTKICGISLQNTDGVINIHRDVPLEVEFYVIDCYGRKFNNDLIGVEYKVSMGNRDIAFASIMPNRDKIRIQGQKIGSTMILVQVVGRQAGIKDVVPINVNIFIEPSRPITIHVGDQVQFKAGSSLDMEWQSSNNHGLKIIPSTGLAQAYAEGQYTVKYGNMESRVTVCRMTDIEKGATAYTYRPLYSMHQQLSDHKNIKRNIVWHCKVLGDEANYFRAVPKNRITQQGSEQIICQLERTSPSKTSKVINLRVAAQNLETGFSISKDFVETMNTQSFFMIQTEKHINPSQHSGIYYIIIDTKQKLDVLQNGGRDQWISANQFNGIKQVISIDFSSVESRISNWEIILRNKRTLQRQILTIGQNKPMSYPHDNDQNKSGWKWTDILVIFMAINFLLIFLYQIMHKNNSGEQYKVYT